MTKPANIVPKKPLAKITISTTFKFANKLNTVEKASDGLVKYKLNLKLSTINKTIMGYKNAIIQDDRKIIFNKKPIPKNNTKNKSKDTANCTIFNRRSPYL